MADTNRATAARKSQSAAGGERLHAQSEGSKTPVRAWLGSCPIRATSSRQPAQPDGWSTAGIIRDASSTIPERPNWAQISKRTGPCQRATEAAGSPTIVASCRRHEDLGPVPYGVDPDSTENTESIVNGTPNRMTFAETTERGFIAGRIPITATLQPTRMRATKRSRFTTGGYPPVHVDVSKIKATSKTR